MSEGSESKTTRDLLRKVEEDRAAEIETGDGSKATESPPAPSDGKKVRSFSSYMSNVKQRQVELAEIKRKEEDELVRKQEEEVRLQKQQDEQQQAEKEKQQSKSEEGEVRLESEELQVPDVAMVDASESSKLETADNHEQIPVTPRQPSMLSSELSQIPSSVERKIEYPSTIQEGGSTPEHTRQTIEQKTPTGPDEDSDADTVYDDESPPKKRGRLVRKSEFAQRPRKKVDFDESDDDDDDDDEEEEIPHRNKKSYGKLQKSFRSTSPGRHQSKKQKGGRDHSGRRMLQRVCEKGNYDLAKELIEGGADVNDQDYAGNTALHEAALSGYTEIVKLLLDNGAKVDIQNGEEDLDTPLIDAAANGHVDTVKMLLRYGADPRIENAGGQNALDSLEEGDAATESLRKMLRDATLKLAKEGKKHDQSGQNSDVEDRARSRSRPRAQAGRRVASRTDLLWMDFTSKSGLDEVYKRSSEGDLEFVGHYLQNVQSPDSEALALAAKFGHTDVVNLFLAFGAKVDLPNDHGLTALMRTVGRGHLTTVKLLLDAGADVLKLSDDGKNSINYAMNSLMVNDEEVELLKSYTGKAPKEPRQSEHEQKSNQSDNGSSESKKEQLKKRKLSIKEEDKVPEVKKKKIAKVMAPASHKIVEQKTVKPLERKSSGSSISHGSSKPETKRVVSGTKSDAKLVTKDVEPAVAVPPPPETEEQKQQRLLKEAEDEKRRQEYEAERLAKRKAREQEFLSNFETEEKKKEEELRKLSEQEEERKLKEAEARLAKLKEQEKLKEEEMKIEEVEKRQKTREMYPTGLRMATFSKTVRSKQDTLPYLPLYKVSIDGTFYVLDLQVVMCLGIEDFIAKYQSDLYSDTDELSKDQKSNMYRFIYPILVKPDMESVSKRLENYNEELAKFLRLKLRWINYDKLMDIMKRDFAELVPLFSTRVIEVDIEGLTSGSKQDFVKPGAIVENPVKRITSISTLIGDMRQKLPLSLRLRPAVVKALARNKRMW